jgi:adenine-specific DNA-methyltransferase
MPSPLTEILHALVPADGSTIGNGALRKALSDRLGREVSEAEYFAAQQALVEAGRLAKGRGRGGSVFRPAPSGEALRLSTQAVPEDAKAPKPKQAAMTLAEAKRAKAQPAAGRKTGDEATVLSYRHRQTRKNNPEVGMVTPDTDADAGTTRWAFDPHLDPVLNFDVGRAQIETLVDEALASGDADTMREALETLKRMAMPYLQWTGKAERTSFAVDTVSLHVHERIDPATILGVIRKRMKDAPAGVGQGDFFRAWFEEPLAWREAIEFYKHERGWANRLVAGDSLLVMNSLLQKEGMAGQVQMIYFDPPYGIKYGSNFQPFVNRRDVKDRKDEDLTQEPEMIKAFRDTWELGIHSYLSYLRDRLLLARELLSESGSVFVQISDENVHHVREICDEIFGTQNFCSEIVYRKTAAVSSPDAKVNTLATVSDLIVWYAVDKRRVKYNQMFLDKTVESDAAGVYVRCQDQDGRRRRLEKGEKSLGGSAGGSRIYRLDNATSTGASDALSVDYLMNGLSLSCGGNKHWKTTISGLSRLARARRVEPSGSTLAYVRFIDDFPVFPVVNMWLDTGTGSFTEDKVYVVQTGTKAVERCILMTTDPGDLVLDPTCGSGTTAFVAEKWGRRWITCDTSRVAVTLAKQRLMTASFDYYALKYPHEGLRGGFIYKTVPHVTLKSIANNPDIDTLWAKHQPAVEAALAKLNAALKAAKAPAFTVTEGGWKGKAVDFAASGKRRTLPSGEAVPADALLEWEVPFEKPAAWSDDVGALLDGFHAARQLRQKAMDDSIAAHAEQETLFDQPQIDKNKLRITGPFTVEAVPFPTVKALDEAAPPAEADASVAREGESSRQHQWRAELVKTGVRGKGGQMLKLADLEPLPDTRHLHCTGTVAETGERVVVSFGPEHAALEQRQVELAMREAGDLFPRPKMILFCAFTFDPEAAKDIDATRGITALKVQMNTDLLTEDLKKARANNQSFWLMGQPDVELRQRKDGLWEVEVHGFDYFDPTSGELVSGGKGRIAAWSLDTDYDERSLFPRQVFFPMAGAKDGWHKLKKDIKAELDERLVERLHGTVSLPFEAGGNRKVAVKIVDDRGIESLKILVLP